jgi:hypothetical protein
MLDNGLLDNVSRNYTETNARSLENESSLSSLPRPFLRPLPYLSPSLSDVDRREISTGDFLRGVSARLSSRRHYLASARLANPPGTRDIFQAGATRRDNLLHQPERRGDRSIVSVPPDKRRSVLVSGVSCVFANVEDLLPVESGR